MIIAALEIESPKQAIGRGIRISLKGNNLQGEINVLARDTLVLISSLDLHIIMICNILSVEAVANWKSQNDNSKSDMIKSNNRTKPI